MSLLPTNKFVMLLLAKKKIRALTHTQTITTNKNKSSRQFYVEKEARACNTQMEKVLFIVLIATPHLYLKFCLLWIVCWVLVLLLHVREKISTQINILSCNDPIRRPKKLVIDSWKQKHNNRIGGVEQWQNSNRSIKKQNKSDKSSRSANIKKE